MTTPLVQHSYGLADVAEPTDSELLAAELALVDAETAWYRTPTPETAADYMAAVAEVIDLHSLYGYGPARSLVVRDAVREVA